MVCIAWVYAIAPTQETDINVNPLYEINGKESMRQGAVVSAPHTRISFIYYSLLFRMRWICWRCLQTTFFLRNLSVI
jgi:hypothetical protein